MDEHGGLMALNVLEAPLRVINIGLASFADDLRAQEVQVVELDWRPPAGGDARLAALLEAMEDE
jgi:FdrA protein